MTTNETGRGHLRVVQIRRAESLPRVREPTTPASSGTMFDLTGKGALVIGGGGGIGGAIAHAFADFGARVAIADLSLDAARPSPPPASVTGPETTVCRSIDVTNPDQSTGSSARSRRSSDKIDILVNSAGINIRKDVIDYRPRNGSRSSMRTSPASSS